jgi:hypothetical protein
MMAVPAVAGLRHRPRRGVVRACLCKAHVRALRADTRAGGCTCTTARPLMAGSVRGSSTGSSAHARLRALGRTRAVDVDGRLRRVVPPRARLHALGHSPTVGRTMERSPRVTRRADLGDTQSHAQRPDRGIRRTVPTARGCERERERPSRQQRGHLASDARVPPTDVGSARAYLGSRTLSMNRCHAAVLTVSTGPLRSVVSRIEITCCP